MRPALYLNICLMIILWGSSAPQGHAAIEDFEYSISNNAVTITGYWGYETNVIVPETLSGYPVTSIGENGFWGADFLSIALPDSVTNIETYAFQSCRNLKNLTLPPLIQELKKGTLYNCTGLTNVVLNPGLLSIEDSAFDGCKMLEEILLSGSLATIGRDAFRGCESLTYVDIPGNVTNIGRNAFMHCHALDGIYVEPENSSYTSSNGLLLDPSLNTLLVCPAGQSGAIEMPDSVTHIADLAFAYCEQVQGVSLSSELVSIGASAFKYCKSLQGLSLPTGIAEIKRGTFSSCESLTNIIWTGGVTNIGEYAFSGCLSLTDMPLVEGLKTIELHAFSGCTSLESIILPDSLVSMESGVFYYCTSLTHIEFGTGLSRISDRCFNKCEKLGSLTIPQTVSEVGDYAFEGCRSLTRVNMGDGTVILSPYCFSFCESLEDLEIGTGVTNVGEAAFYSCTNLTIIDLPENLVTIGQGAFFRNGMTNVMIPSSVRQLSSSAFDSCIFLNEISVDPLNSYYKSVDGILYDHAGALLIKCPEGKCGDIILPSDTRSIQAFGLSRCFNITNVWMNEGLLNIESSAFEQCTNLAYVALSASLTNMSPFSFWVCDSLTEITIPKKVSYIGPQAFSACTALEAVYFLGDVPLSESSIFYGTEDVTVYRLEERSGWPEVPGYWENRPTALWDPLNKEGDADGNGLYDGWEQYNFGSPGIDPDLICSNRLNTVAEAFTCGISPVDTTAYFELHMPYHDLLEWNGVSGRVYSVYQSTNLISGFTCIASNISWNTEVYTNDTEETYAEAYYQLSVQLEK